MADHHTGAPRKMATRTAARRGTLSKDRILRAALQVVDEEGLDALSLRRIAAQLGVSAMSLYRHYRNKAEIEAGIVDHVVGTYAVTEHDEGDWPDWVHATCAQMRQAMCAHPGLMALLDKAALNSANRGTNSLGVMEAMLSRLRGAGLAPGAAARLFHTLMAVTIGSVVLMNRPARRAISGGSEGPGDDVRGLDVEYERVPSRQFPHVAAMSPQLARVWEAGDFEVIVLQIIAAFAPGAAGTAARHGRTAATGKKPK